MKKILLTAFGLLMGIALVACTQQTFKKADLNEIMADIEKNVPMNDMMSLTAGNLSDYGIDAADALQFVYKTNRSGIKADEVAMFEASNAGAAGRIKEKLEARLAQKASEFNNYLPEEYAVVTQCGVAVYGNYVTMFISSEAAKMTEIFESYVQ